MAYHVEANSLSDITQLAGNPPKYPRNPTEPKREPLTLYIARVPGSRDIILTTLKPQLKNVTAEDISSSLYYLHLETDKDLDLLEEQAAMSNEKQKENSFPRKPLPDSARSSLDTARAPIELSRQGSSASTLSRKPVASGSALESPQVPIHKQFSIKRRPLGPRTLPVEPEPGANPLRSLENRPPKFASAVQDYSPAPRSSIESTSSYVIPNPLSNENPQGFSISLIRRDPTSGAQWNIGTVRGHAAPEEGQTRRPKSTPRSKPYFDMSIHLSTPGYNYFRDKQPASHIRDGPTDAAAVRASIEAQRSQPMPPGAGFDRHVRMEGTSFWSRASFQHQRSQSDISTKEATTRGRSSSGTAFINGASALLNLKGMLNTENPSLGSRDLQPKGYSFVSPWGGRCKFTTGAAGRSLRCKHTLPAPISSSNTLGLSSPQSPASVSELRFNLPTTEVLKSTLTSDPNKESVSAESGGFKNKFGHIRNKLSGDKKRPALPPRPHPSSYAALYPSDDEAAQPLPPRNNTASFRTQSAAAEDVPPPTPPAVYTTRSSGDERQDYNAEDRLDLSLGQEKAGGGNRGKRAKLGKLIIQDEGLKMLDLVVAANMGIWWSVWETEGTPERPKSQSAIW